MLKIGIFSKLSRVSVRMLRYYDDQGLLSPVQIDPFSGYRYYSEDQLLTAERIASLRRIGFGLNEVKRLISPACGREDWENALEHQRIVLRQEEQEVRSRILLLENTLECLRKEEKTMEYPVTIKELPERYVASVRGRIPRYQCEQELWTILRDETSRLHVQERDPSYALAIYHDEEHVDENPDVEVQIAVKGTYPDTEHVKFKTVPSTLIASTTYKGPYERMDEVITVVASWVTANGYDFEGPTFAIYHVSPAQASNPEEYVTEICFAVKKK